MQNYLTLNLFGFEADAQGWGLVAMVLVAAIYYFRQAIVAKILKQNAE
jgi:hypothetical protein